MTAVTLISDITYAEADGTELQFDLYRPDIEGPGPAAARAQVPGAAAYVAWQPGEDGPWSGYVDGAYAVVNRAGGSIYTFGQRQTHASISAETQKRVRGIDGLVGAMARAQAKPQVFVCASSVGTYGFDGFSDAEFSEASAPATDF